MRLAWVSVGVLLVACSTSESTQVPVGATSEAIQDGVTDTTHAYAVGVCFGPGPGRCEGICSGALITPNLIATARHCVSESPEVIDCTSDPTFGGDHAASSFWITTNTDMTGPNVDPSSGWYRGTQVFTPSDNHICGNDLALIQIDSVVPANVATPITPDVQHQMWDARYYTASYTAIGYGLTAPEPAGSTSTDTAGTRRIKQNILITCVPDSTNLTCPTGFNAAEFVGGDGTCQGDSGSSAFEQNTFKAGTPVSFGVLSRGGESSDGSSCQGSLYSRFDAHRDFVVQSATTASQNWTLYAEPSWTGTPDAPSTADAGSTPGTTPLGEACSQSKECASDLCATVQTNGASSQICTKACSATTTCDSGFSCQTGYCLKADASPATPVADAGTSPTTETVVTTKHGCSFSPRSSGGSAGGWLLALGLALTAVRRRRN